MKIVHPKAGRLISFPGRANQGRDVYVERDFQWIENHRLSARDAGQRKRGKICSKAGSGLFGALRLTPRSCSGPPLRAFAAVDGVVTPSRKGNNDPLLYGVPENK
jgi:hypothetical protein